MGSPAHFWFGTMTWLYNFYIFVDCFFVLMFCFIQSFERETEELLKMHWIDDLCEVLIHKLISIELIIQVDGDCWEIRDVAKSRGRQQFK